MKKLLITNDDGIDSYFLRALVEAHQGYFQVRVVAPLGEQSWIGRAYSRNREVHLSEYEHFDCPAWALDGTPSDCVNIALKYILADERPDVVISGINLGYNASFPFILSSGTLAGALEGCFWGLPAIAYSKFIPHDQFEHAKDTHGKVDGELKRSLLCAAERAAQMTLAISEQAPEPLCVHNINFPSPTHEHTTVEETHPDHFQIGSLFEKTGPSSFRFAFSDDFHRVNKAENTDARCLRERGNISHSILNFARV